MILLQKLPTEPQVLSLLKFLLCFGSLYPLRMSPTIYALKMHYISVVRNKDVKDLELASLQGNIKEWEVHTPGLKSEMLSSTERNRVCGWIPVAPALSPQAQEGARALGRSAALLLAGMMALNKSPCAKPQPPHRKTVATVTALKVVTKLEI